MMRRCKLEFLIFFKFSDFGTTKKKKSWSGQDGKSTEQLLINGGDSQLFMGVIPNISHWQGQVFPFHLSISSLHPLFLLPYRSHPAPKSQISDVTRTSTETPEV